MPGTSLQEVTVCSPLPHGLTVAPTAALPPGGALVKRLIMICLLLGVEIAAENAWKLIGSGRFHIPWRPLFVGLATSTMLRLAVVFMVSFAAFATSKCRTAILVLPSELIGSRPSYFYLFVNCLAWCFVVCAYPLLLSGQNLAWNMQIAMVAVRWAAAVSAVVSAALLFVKPLIWLEIFRVIGFGAWCYSLAAACAVSQVAILVWTASASLTALTFRAVTFELSTLGLSVVQDPLTRSLGTSNFSVEIAPLCSGMEGLALILVFGSAWLCLFRHKYRFPHAFILMPAALTAIWLLNTFRIAGLILIGDAGAPDVALQGFHSQAGWIAFILVAIAMWLSLQGVRWFSAATRPEPYGTVWSSPTAAYLLPFLSVLAVSILSRAALADFEWLYPLRLLVAGAVLWAYRSYALNEKWTFSWLAPLTGITVFAIWMGADLFIRISRNDELHSGLAATSPVFRSFWIFSRATAAIVTVPVTEELAFRAFLARRLISSSFEKIPYSRLTWVPILLSCVLFGSMHGNRWLAGVLAGICYCTLLRRTGRIGDAIAAHATTNALIAVAVLFFNRWDLW